MRGALVPHAPLLLPSVTTKADQLRDVWDGFSRVRIPEDSLILILTPHAETAGVYTHARGSLKGFGVEGEHELVIGLVDDLDIPAIDGPLDHGALVPLALLDRPNPTLVLGLGDEYDGVDQVRKVASDRDVFVIASAHTSARLSEGAPLPYSFDAVRLDARLITEIETDCVAARDLADELWAVGDSCSRSTLKAFGELFAGAEGSVLAYAAPFGVGYPVVTAEIDV
ncbi:MAG: Catalytic LigB subunit of aromatic ring-opening dioxygenase [Actinomycetota bacterium]|nr:Catalytic LigB subunit of aromatic ring-opening dioxygenase [Actinomycetota bacterium]